jgi:predicted metal-dependent hydrolase
MPPVDTGGEEVGMLRRVPVDDTFTRCGSPPAVAPKQPVTSQFFVPGCGRQESASEIVGLPAYRFPVPSIPPADPPRSHQDEVEIRRSARRRRTVSAYRDGERTVVLLPARMSSSEERRWVALMLQRLDAKEQRGRRSDAALVERAAALSRRYLDGQARPASVRWVDNQGSRWGSCTATDASIRLSSRLRTMPAWVVDYVLVHELAHLIVPTHGPQFWALVNRYPRTERARGYLQGVAAAAGLRLSDDEETDSDVDVDVEVRS